MRGVAPGTHAVNGSAVNGIRARIYRGSVAGEFRASGEAAVSGVGLIPLFLFSGPYEEVQVKS